MRKNSAFTLVEIIIVIVIFGIIATIGANIIARMYMNYMQARTVNYIQTQSGIVLEQIAKRLQYRVKASAIALRRGDGSILRLEDSGVDNSYDVVQWIGYSNEAQLNNAAAPGWSGFIDMDSAGTDAIAKTLSTPGSNLVAAAGMMNILSGGRVTLGAGAPAALIFKGLPADGGITTDVGYGWDGNGGNAAYMLTVTQGVGATTFNIAGNNPTRFREHYYLAHSAYALVPDFAPATCGNDCSNTNFNLELRYNYQPWNAGSTFVGASSAILARNVNLFRIKQTGSTIRLKLCLHDGGNSGLNNDRRPVVACKEEVVL